LNLHKTLFEESRYNLSLEHKLHIWFFGHQIWCLYII